MFQSDAFQNNAFQVSIIETNRRRVTNSVVLVEQNQTSAGELVTKVRSLLEALDLKNGERVSKSRGMLETIDLKNGERVAQAKILVEFLPGEGEIEIPTPEPERISFMDHMFFRALDSKFNQTEILDAYASMIWTDKFDEVGDFEVHGPLNKQLLSIFKTATYIYNSKTRGLMVIEKPKIEYSIDEGDTITMSGRSIASLLDRRVALRSYTVFDDVPIKISTIIANLLNEAFGPSDPDRYWGTAETTGCSFAVVDKTTVNSPTLPANTGLQITIGTNILELVVDLCKTFGLGFRCEYLHETRVLQFIIYEGRNLTSTVIFSDHYDNLLSSAEEISYETEKNTILVTGRAEDPDTKIPLYPTLVAEEGATGLLRKETYVSADVDPALHLDNEVEQLMTEGEYRTALAQAGATELSDSKYKPARNFEGEILESLSCYYGVGDDNPSGMFKLGDLVSFRPPHSLVTLARLDGMTYSDDDKEGKTLAPSFRYLPGMTVNEFSGTLQITAETGGSYGIEYTPITTLSVDGSLSLAMYCTGIGIPNTEASMYVGLDLFINGTMYGFAFYCNDNNQMVLESYKFQGQQHNYATFAPILNRWFTLNITPTDAWIEDNHVVPIGNAIPAANNTWNYFAINGDGPGGFYLDKLINNQTTVWDGTIAQWNDWGNEAPYVFAEIP